jgi:O-antigen ligase
MFLSFVLETFFVQTLMLWLLGGFAIYTGIHTRKFYFQWYSVLFLAMFLVCMLAFLRQPELKFSNVELSLSLIIFPAIFSLIKVNLRQWEIIQMCVVVGFALFLLIILQFYIVNICMQGLFRESLTHAKSHYVSFLKSPFYNHPSFLSIILAPSIPMCFNLATKAKKQWQQWLWLSFVPLLMFIVFVSGSRIGLPVCGALIILCSIYFFKKLNVTSKIVIALAFLVTLVLFSQTTINYTEDPARKEMNHLSIEKIKERPLLGHGHSTQRASLEEHIIALEESTVLQGITFGYFHNTYLDKLFQHGIIGSLPFFLLLLYLIYTCIKKRDFFLLSFLIIYLPFFIVETPLVGVKGMMPMMLLLCLIMNIQHERTQLSQNKN